MALGAVIEVVALLAPAHVQPPLVPLRVATKALVVDDDVCVRVVPPKERVVPKAPVIAISPERVSAAMPRPLVLPDPSPPGHATHAHSPVSPLRRPAKGL